ncbi:hypothetical protein [Comamonas terrigena]|uniref:hypothetical protein n=1 Tax=Comamonas terrigena TaxID=32013 RepID=UPI0028964429|nr:hypothetical protein [Comamonas terrigena]
MVAIARGGAARLVAGSLPGRLLAGMSLDMTFFFGITDRSLGMRQMVLGAPAWGREGAVQIRNKEKVLCRLLYFQCFLKIKNTFEFKCLYCICKILFYRYLLVIFCFSACCLQALQPSAENSQAS